MKSRFAFWAFIVVMAATVPQVLAQSMVSSGCRDSRDCPLHQQQGQHQTATGGTASGGAANATTGSSSSNASTGSSMSSSSTGASSSNSSTSATNAATNGPQSNSQISNYNDVHQTPATFVPPQFSTAPCQQAGGVGGAGGLFSFGVSGSRTNRECEKRATAQDFAAIGNPEAAAKILCKTKASKAAGLTMNDCLKITQKPENAQPTSQGAANAPSTQLDVQAAKGDTPENGN
jgi:hypothetical protein